MFHVRPSPEFLKMGISKSGDDRPEACQGLPPLLFLGKLQVGSEAIFGLGKFAVGE
jgi:hypothetical protein